MYDFIFDQPLDPSLFSLDPPKGYTVTTKGKPATWQQNPPAEKNLLAPEVIPGVGLGPVKFGMSKEEVIKLLGKPDIMEEKNGCISIDYPSRGYGLCDCSKTRRTSSPLAFSRNRSTPSRSAISPARRRKESASVRV